MTTTKSRLNITTEPEMRKALANSARQDGVPIATKAAELLRMALELEEDIVLGKMAKKLDKTKTKFVSHHFAWK